MRPSPGSPPAGFYARFGKRPLDLVIAAFALILAGPLMLLISCLIKIEDGGPVLYRQERIGRGGRPFDLLKFRSMVPGAETKGAGILVEKGDSRITRVGRVLRRLSLDELAQVLNVIRGDMSVVGPRPGLRYQVEQYDEEQKGRLLVRPGITGWAQIKGRGAIRWPERIRLDLEYVARLSLWMDLSIILRTAPLLLSGADQISDIDYWKTKQREREEAARRKDAAGGHGNGS
ncbi:MAG: sugar transferase [Candidatus Eisenbacteria bacterium]|nr:sugar transferase [Candidatus Eisenbacteria bacterium]